MPASLLALRSSTFVEDPLVAAIAEGAPIWRAADGRAGLRYLMRSFIDSYAADGFAAVWEEAAHNDAQLADVRRQITRVIVDAVEAELRAAAERGLVADDLDPAVVAPALTAMVDRYCYVTYAFDRRPRPPSAEHATDVLVELWYRAIGLRDTPAEARSSAAPTA